MELVSWPGGSWEATARMVVFLFVAYLAVMWVTLAFWTYRDIRQRSRDPIMQTVSVLLVLLFFVPGQVIYMILRPRYTLIELYERSLEEEALLQELEDQKACPTCKRRVQDDFLMCPSCRSQLKEPCRSCAKPLSYAWVSCPYCGLEKPPREGARPARPAVARGGGRPPVAQPQPARPVAAAPRQEQATLSAPQQPSSSAPQRDPFANRSTQQTDDSVIDATARD
jgi:hypothetical protein